MLLWCWDEVLPSFNTQVHNTMFSFAELVVTRRPCMADERRLRACTPLVDVRTWGGRHVAGSCACSDEAAATLSCSGVGHVP